MKILYIEDDPINALIVTKFLENDFSVETAESSEKSLRMLQEKSFDLILLDLNLGHDKETGLSLFQKIQLLDSYGNIPVIALTANSDTTERDAYLQAGFSGFIVKPVNRDNLIAYLSAFKESSKAV